MQWETATPLGFPVCMRHNVSWVNFFGVFRLQPKKHSIAFGKSTSQRIYSKQRTHKIGENNINTA